MKLRRTLGMSLGSILLARAVAAAPVAEEPLDVAPLLFVPSTDTSEPARAIAAGAGRGVVLYGSSEMKFFSEDFATFDLPTKAPLADGTVVFDGNDFLFAALTGQGTGGSDYKVAPTLRRYAPDGSPKDAAPVVGTIQTGVILDQDSAIACKAAGECVMAYSLRLYGEGGETGQDVWLAPIKDGVFSAPVRVTTAAQDQQHPAVTWDGSNWIVVWVDFRFATGSGSDVKGTQLYGARVTAAGAVLDPIGVPLATFAEIADLSNPNFGAPVPQHLGLSHSAGTTQLVWRGADSSRIVGRRLGSDLASPDAAPVVLAAPGAANARTLELVPDAAGFTVFFSKGGDGFDKSNLQLVQVGLDGKAVGTPSSVGTRYANAAFVASLGNGNFAVAKTVPSGAKPFSGSATDAWVEQISPAGKELAATYVSKSATVVEGRALAQTSGLGVVVYADNRKGTNDQYSPREVFAAVLTDDGKVLPADGLLLSVDARSPVSAAVGGGRALVVHQAGETPTHDIVGVLLDGAGAIVKKLSFGTQPYDETSPLVAFDGTNFLVSWVDRGNGYDAGVFRRMSPDGAFIDPALVFLVPGETSNTSVQDLACSGAGVCVARNGGRFYPITDGIVGADKTQSEVGIDSFSIDPFALVGGQDGFAVFLRSGKTFAEVAFQRFGPDLLTGDQPPIDLYDANSVSGLEPYAKTAGWNGTRFVASWTNSKGISLSSLGPTGGPSLPYVVIAKPRGVPGPYTSIAKEATRNLLVTGRDGRTLVGYQDNGRFVVRGVTGLEDDSGGGGAGGTSGEAGAGGESGEGGMAAAGKGGASGKGGTSGKGGAAGKGGTSGKGGAAGKSGAAGKGGASGKGGSSGKGGAAGKGGASGKGGAAGKGGASGKGGSAGKGGAAAGGATGKGGSGGEGRGGSLSTGGAPGGSGLDVNDDGGCGCRVAGEPTREPTAWAAALALLGITLGRGARRRARPHHDGGAAGSGGRS